VLFLCQASIIIIVATLAKWRQEFISLLKHNLREVL